MLALWSLPQLLGASAVVVFGACGGGGFVVVVVVASARTIRNVHAAVLFVAVAAVAAVLQRGSYDREVCYNPRCLWWCWVVERRGGGGVFPRFTQVVSF